MGLTDLVIPRLQKLLDDTANLSIEVAQRGFRATPEQLVRFDSLKQDCALQIVRDVKDALQPIEEDEEVDVRSCKACGKALDEEGFVRIGQIGG